jgi:hypothetical protein
MMTKAFISKVGSGAQAAQKTYGILASLSIAQAILESGWGLHAPGNMLFGIKANGWTGKTQVLTTKEYVNGKAITIKDTFRAYTSWTDSIIDHAAFLVANRRYANLVNCTNYKTACVLIQADGYATDPTYSKQLISLIEQYGLHSYDTLSPITTIDTKGTLSGNFNIGGWAVNSSGLLRVDIYADGSKGLGSVTKFSARPDVAKVHSNYPGVENSGFNLTVKSGTLKAGQHTISAAGIGKDKSVCWESAKITVK